MKLIIKTSQNFIKNKEIFFFLNFEWKTKLQKHENSFSRGIKIWI